MIVFFSFLLRILSFLTWTSLRGLYPFPPIDSTWSSHGLSLEKAQPNEIHVDHVDYMDSIYDRRKSWSIWAPWLLSLINKLINAAPYHPVFYSVCEVSHCWFLLTTNVTGHMISTIHHHLLPSPTTTTTTTLMHPIMTTTTALTLSGDTHFFFDISTVCSSFPSTIFCSTSSYYSSVTSTIISKHLQTLHWVLFYLCYSFPYSFICLSNISIGWTLRWTFSTTLCLFLSSFSMLSCLTFYLQGLSFPFTHSHRLPSSWSLFFSLKISC